MTQEEVSAHHDRRGTARGPSLFRRLYFTSRYDFFLRSSSNYYCCYVFAFTKNECSIRATDKYITQLVTFCFTPRPSGKTHSSIFFNFCMHPRRPPCPTSHPSAPPSPLRCFLADPEQTCSTLCTGSKYFGLQYGVEVNNYFVCY